MIKVPFLGQKMLPFLASASPAQVWIPPGPAVFISGSEQGAVSTWECSKDSKDLLVDDEVGDCTTQYIGDYTNPILWLWFMVDISIVGMLMGY